MRLITAVFCAPVLVAFALTGCGGGEGVSVENTAADSSATSVTASSLPPVAAQTAPDTTPTGPVTTPAPLPTPSTGSATLSWVAPTQNTDGSRLTNLAGYIIYYGTDSSALTQTIQVSSASALSYVITGLATRTTWYFSVTSYSAAGEESVRSPVLSKAI